MLALKNNEYVTATTIAKSTGVDIENCKALLQKASAFQYQSNPCFRCIEVKNTDGVDYAYGIERSGICLYIALLMKAKVLVHMPDGYQMQIAGRGKRWFDMNEVVESWSKKDQK